MSDKKLLSIACFRCGLPVYDDANGELREFDNRPQHFPCLLAELREQEEQRNKEERLERAVRKARVPPLEALHDIIKLGHTSACPWPHYLDEECTCHIAIARAALGES
jgi:hypothetical protein